MRCRCWQDAKVTPPAALADLIIFADGDVSLSVSWESHPGLNNDLDEWIYSSPCSHEDMEQAHEGVGNWAAYRAFQRELTTLGQFPTLTAELPNSNNGFSPTSSATAALTELQLFTELCGVRDTAVLHDTDTDEIIWEQLHAFGGANVITAEGEMGVDPNGFWIRRDGAEVFRAMHLTRFLNGKLRNLAVRTQPLSPEVHNPTVTALTNLFEASLATGNPVVWC